MEINKNELKKISRKFRTIASNVMHADFREQNANLEEFVNYIERTDLINQYLKSIEYEIVGLDDLLNKINSSYGTESLNLGSDSNKRTYLLYKVFKQIVENNFSTYNFGWAYTSSRKFQDMAEAFGKRLIYPFVIGIENYLKDISTDMGFDEDNSQYSVNINSSGVQVNIAEHGSAINALQENNFQTKEIDKEIKKLEDFIRKIENDNLKSVLNQNLESIKSEIKEPNPKKNHLFTCLNTMYIVANTIAILPDLATGIQLIANMLGVVI